MREDTGMGMGDTSDNNSNIWRTEELADVWLPGADLCRLGETYFFSVFCSRMI